MSDSPNALNDPHQLINSQVVRRLCGIRGSMTLYRRVRDMPNFPKPATKIAGRNYWREADVRRYLAERCAEQAAASPPTRPRTRLITTN